MPPTVSPPELPQILVVRRQDDAGPAARTVGSAVAEEARFVGLHRPVEVVEVRILAERLGVGRGGLGVGLGADDLGLLQALRLDRARLLLAGGAHPLIGRVERRPLGKVGALDPDVDDLGAILDGDAVERVSDIVHHLAALGAEQGRERPPAELVAQRRAEDRPQLLADILLGSRGDIHAQRVDDPVAGIGVDLEPQLVGRQHLLVLHLDRLDALVDPDDAAR